MAAYFDSINLVGMANWMRVRPRKRWPAMKFFDFIAERADESPWRRLTAAGNGPATGGFRSPGSRAHISAGSTSWSTCPGGKRSRHQQFLQWFVAEQVEEEATADGIVQQLRLVKDAPGGVFLLDRELGQRTFVPPSAAGP